MLYPNTSGPQTLTAWPQVMFLETKISWTMNSHYKRIFMFLVVSLCVCVCQRWKKGEGG